MGKNGIRNDELRNDLEKISSKKKSEEIQNTVVRTVDWRYAGKFKRVLSLHKDKRGCL